MTMHAQMVQRFVQKQLDGALQRLGIAPRTGYDCGVEVIKWRVKAAPVVAHGFHEACVFVDDGIGRVATFKRMLSKHALTPSMNGVDGGFVHPLSREIELSRGRGAFVGIGVLGDQIAEKVVGDQLIAKGRCGSSQTVANAFAKFGCGCPCECNDENLRG